MGGFSRLGIVAFMGDKSTMATGSYFEVTLPLIRIYTSFVQRFISSSKRIASYCVVYFKFLVRLSSRLCCSKKKMLGAIKHAMETINGDGGRKIKGTVVLMKKNVLGFNDFNASVIDRVHELVGKGVAFRLVSSKQEHGLNARLGEPAYLEDWITTITPLNVGETAYDVTFDWDEHIGVPGAFTVRNDHHSEFYLKTLTLEGVPGQDRIHFVCNSWVYPSDESEKERIFFCNSTLLPHQTPLPLRKLRKDELKRLRGDGKGKLKEGDRIYDYALYNDLANPDRGPMYLRPVLGGSSEYPYPRRGRTGRPRSESDPSYESRLSLLSSLNVYVPRDERFGHLKMGDFLGYALKSVAQVVRSELEGLDLTYNEFDSFEDTLSIYEGGLQILNNPFLQQFKDRIEPELLKEIFRTDGEGVAKFPMPQVIEEDKTAWRTDEEFCREMLAGVNPVVISRLEEFPPKSKLDRQRYGNQDSTICEQHIEHNLEGMTVSEAMEKKRVFILNYHDVLMPYVTRINTTSTKIYATRTLLFLKDDGTLKPLAIELSLPHPDGDEHGAVSKVYTPAQDGVEGSIWQLAKAYVAVNDSGYHQLISHWLHTHAVIEPFIIAANRQLSVLHPIYKLLHPHFRDTMNINALARQTLINAGGILELTVFPSKYAMEMSSVLYKSWKFPEQSLPEDLKKRGMAVDDPSSRHGIRLLLEDYPFAVDGLEIWFAIREWVEEYCRVYYKTDAMVKDDEELQSWWKELREVGHGDLKDEAWWPKMCSCKDLIESCTIIIWVASALHAAINFGQYPYGGYLPNRPSMSRRFMPEKGTPEHEELRSDPEKGFLKTITSQFQTLLGISLIEILSRHSSDEVYLGQRDTPEWTTEKKALVAFERFGKKLEQIEDRIIEMNKDQNLKNRFGPVSMPYTLLVPSSAGGLTGRGIPNSVSI